MASVTGYTKAQSDARARADVHAPIPTGVAATDTANLDAAVAATPDGGVLFLPARSALGLVYQRTAPLVFTKSMSVIGQQMTETWKGTVASGALNHPNSPGVSGTVIQQNTAATDVIQITGSGVSVNFENIGLTFGSSIINTNTGHGINSATTVNPGAGGHDTGNISFTWRNVTVYGHDGNHYAAVLLNSMYYTLSHFHSYGGGILSIQCDSFVGNYGNGVFVEPYGEVYNAGTADGYNFQGRTNSNGGAAGTGTLNLLTFIRPQCNVTNAAATAGTQKLWNANGGAALPLGVDVISPDMEVNPSNSTNQIDFGGLDSGTTVRAGGLLSKAPLNGFSRGAGSDHRVFTTTTTWTVPRNVYEFRVRAIGGGGAGGGGGSNAAAAANIGGGGGGAGMVVETAVACTPGQSFVFTIGAGGTLGAGGAAGGNTGIVGGNGGNTTISNTAINATGGGGGAPGAASSTTTVSGGWYGRTGNTSMANTPGFGGNGQSPNGINAVQFPPGVVGGGGGGASSTTLGGGGGGASTYPLVAYAHQSGGSQGTSGTVNGVAGTTAVTPGCGGGGGGGALVGGAGGAGGAGAPGSVEIWY